MSSSKHRGGARGRQTSGDPRRAHASDDTPELDLFTVLTALGTATHADSTPISQEGLYALANALLGLAAQERWEFAGTATLVLHQAIGSARSAANAPIALVPVAIADPEVLIELGADPDGSTSLDELQEAGLAVQVVPGLVMLSAPAGGTGRRRGGTRSVTVRLPGGD
jgi:hypothetical protein